MNFNLCLYKCTQCCLSVCSFFIVYVWSRGVLNFNSIFGLQKPHIFFSTDDCVQREYMYMHTYIQIYVYIYINVLSFMAYVKKDSKINTRKKCQTDVRQLGLLSNIYERTLNVHYSFAGVWVGLLAVLVGVFICGKNNDDLPVGIKKNLWKKAYKKII